MVLLSNSLILVGCSLAPVKPDVIPHGDYEYTKEHVSWMIQREMKENSVKGLSIALVDDQQVVWAEGFGYADVANRLLATPNTIYRVGSISKLFTVIAIMQLAEQGLIDIDQPLKTYLPEFSIKSHFSCPDPVTPRSIMTHHSGLPSLWSKGAFTQSPFTNVVNEIQDEYVVFCPNFVFFYSNLGFNLLGTMIERVSGKDFASYLNENVFRPMGMTHSSFVLTPDLETSLSKGYTNEGEGRHWPIRDLPAGSLYTDVIDLSRFIKMILHKGQSGPHEILKPETMSKMLKVQNEDISLDFDLRIGLGWFLVDYGVKSAGPVVSHGGGTPMFFSHLMILPEHKLGVVVVTNSATAHPMVEKVAATALKLALEAKAGIVQPVRVETLKAETIPISQELLNSYEGRYVTPVGIVSVTPRQGGLQARVMGRKYDLDPQEVGWFGVTYKILGLFPRSWGNRSISFATVSGREVVILRLRDGFRYLVGEKVHPRPISKVWLDRLGEYEVINPDEYPQFEKIHLRYEDGFLIANATVNYISEKEEKVKVLSPISDTQALILNLGQGEGMSSIQINTIDHEERLLYSGYEFRRISK